MTDPLAEAAQQIVTTPPVAPEPVTLDRMKAMLAALPDPVPHPRQLHVGAAILAWFRGMAETARPHDLTAAFGCPVILDDRLESGQWQFRDHVGKVMTEGRVGEPGEYVIYHRDHGFFAFDPDRVGGLGIQPDPLRPFSDPAGSEVA